MQWISAGDLEDERREVSLPGTRPWAQMGTDFEIFLSCCMGYDVLELPLTPTPSLLQHICSAGTERLVGDGACADV